MEFYIIIILQLILFSMALHRYKLKFLQGSQRQGLSNISQIKALISLIQIHRGLSSAWLNGDDTKQKQLQIIEQNIHTETQYFQSKTSINTNSRWTSFIDHWGRLNKQDSGRDSDNNFKQHTQLITNLLYLLEDEAERNHLNATSLPKFKNVGFVWRELAVTAETIGQSRAIGMGIATSKVCTSVHKIRLSFLLQKIQQTMDETLPQLSALECFAHKHSDLLKIATSKIEFLISTIERELIVTSEVTIDKDEYFALATDSISALDNIFAHQIEQIEHTI